MITPVPGIGFQPQLSQSAARQRELDVIAAQAARHAVMNRMGPPPMMGADPAMPSNVIPMDRMGPPPAMDPSLTMSPPLPADPMLSGSAVPLPTSPVSPVIGSAGSGGPLPLPGPALPGQPSGSPPPLAMPSPEPQMFAAGGVVEAESTMLPDVIPAHDLIGPMFGANPDGETNDLLARLSNLTTARNMDEALGANDPATSPMAQRQYPPAPVAFVKWLASSETSGINEVGDDFVEAHKKDPSNDGLLWEIAQGLAESSPDVLPPELLLIVKSGGANPSETPAPVVAPAPGMAAA